MKITIHIFTIYIFALSLVPCGDGGGGIVEIVQHLLERAHERPTDHEQHSRDCGDDVCSVFCICSCCYTAIDTVKEIPLPQRIFIASPKPTLFFIPHFNSIPFNHSIWQPPQLG